MAEIRGTYDSRFRAMADLLSANIDSGDDVGASVAVTLDGDVVVDIWAGWTDETRTTPGSPTPSSTSGRAPRPSPPSPLWCS
jgi:hypothetical protein